MGFHYNVMFSCSNLFLSDSRFLKNGNFKRVQKFHHISFLDLFYWPELFSFRGNTFKRGGGGGYKPLFICNHLFDGKFLDVILSL